jgi:hypothetical protein
MLISTKFSILSRISGCLSQYLYQRLIPPLFLVQLSLLRLHYSLTHQPLHLSQRLQFFQLHLSLRRALESRYQPLDQMFIQQCVPLMSCLTPYHTRPHLNSKSLRDQRRPSQNLRSQPIRRLMRFPRLQDQQLPQLSSRSLVLVYRIPSRNRQPRCISRRWRERYVYVAQNHQFETYCHQSQGRRPSLPALPTMKSSQEDPRLNLSVCESKIDSQNRSASQKPQNSDIQLSQPPFFATRSVVQEMTESMTRELEPSSHDHRRQEPDTLDFHRRNADLFESSEQLTIPPKRELPFPKPREIRPRSISVSEFSPLPKPTPMSRPKSASLTTQDQAIDQTKDTDSTPVVKATKKRVAQRKSTTVKPPEIAESPPPAQPSKVDAATSQASPQDEPSPLAAKSIATASRPTSAASALQSKTAAPKKRAAPARPPSAAKRPRMVNQCTQTEMISDRDLAIALQTLRKESASAPIFAQLTPTSVPAPATLPPESYLDAIDNFVTKHKVRPAPKELWEQPGWAEADEEQRQMLLNDFICDNLENKDFLQLCEDAAVAWRRIGLGI